MSRWCCAVVCVPKYRISAIDNKASHEKYPIFVIRMISYPFNAKHKCLYKICWVNGLVWTGLNDFGWTHCLFNTETTIITIAAATAVSTPQTYSDGPKTIVTRVISKKEQTSQNSSILRHQLKFIMVELMAGLR